MKQRGTGFTNVSKILQANQGNRLGQTVSSGIQQASREVKTGIQQAQDKFKEESEKNRLDTAEAAEQRQNILGRFSTQPMTAQSGSAPQQAQQQPSQNPRETTNVDSPIVNSTNTRVPEQQPVAPPQTTQTTAPQNVGSQLGLVSNELSKLKEELSRTRKFKTRGGGPLGFSIGTNSRYGELERLIAQKEKEMSTLSGQQKEFNTFEENRLNQEKLAQQELDRQNAINIKELEPSESELERFRQFRTGTYTGPNQLQDAGALMGQAAQAEQFGSLTRSAGGQQELLRRFVGGDGYTSGQRRLDQAILSQDPTANLGAAARSARGSLSEVERANEQAANVSRELVGRARDFGQETMQQIQQSKAPITSAIDQRLQEKQAEQTQLQDRFNKVNDIITGQGEFSRIPAEQRAILGINAAANAGMLTNQDVEALVGQGGLLQRGLNAGANLPQLISERLKINQAQNLTRAGVASEEERARLSALNRLAGGLDSDFEFAGQNEAFRQARGALDFDSLNKEIIRAEDEKARNDAAFRARLDAEREESQRFFNRVISGGMNTIGGNMESISGVFDGNLSDFGSGLAGMQYGLTQMGANAPLALAEGLLKLNVGGQSLANTAVGRELLKLNQGAGNLLNKNMDYAYDIARQFTSKPIDATGRVIGDAFNSAGQVVGGLVGGVGNTLKKVFSDETLKKDVSYDPKDVEKFMNRIKASSYDYKDEVKESPLASKNREIGVMAQDLEKSKLGKEAVKDTKIGKVVDYDNLGPKMLASIANLNERLKKMENN